MPLILFHGAALMFSSGGLFLLLSAVLAWRNRGYLTRAQPAAS